jgi:hypothetical protein
MIDQDAQLQDLPDYWQGQISKLRAENKMLRGRVNHAPDIELSPKWMKTLTDLRKENARNRIAKNEALAELDRVVGELDNHTVSGASFWDAFNFRRPEMVACRNA